MTAQIGMPVRIVGLVALLLAAGMMAYMFTAGAASTVSGGVNVPAVVSKPTGAIALAKDVAAKAGAPAGAKAATAAPAVKTATPAKAKQAPAAAATPAKAKTKAKPAKTAGPPTIASLLKTHQVVVVLLYDPQSQVDDYSLAEAALGAKRAKAGFLRVNVLDQKQAAPFAAAYGVMQDPTVLFFTRPGTLVQKLTGFQDNETVAQAAANAAAGAGAKG